MSTSPEPEFDLEKLFLPSWAQESADVNRYAKYTGDEGGARRFDDRGGGGRRPPPRRDGPRPAGGGPQRPGGGDRPGGPRREGDRGPRMDGGRGGPPRRDGRGGGGRPERDQRREAPLPLPEINVTLMPDDKGVESISRQIKMSGRSFPLFDIAQMILQKPERQQVKFEVRKKPDGAPMQQLFLCAIDDTIWLSEQEAVDHALNKHFGMFYQAERKPTDPPKGTYTFVAQCGMSGNILGPPNYHDYQNQLHKLHAERFSRMPFDAFKARVKIVKEEAVVKKWIEDQSFKTEFIVLNVPEALRLASREEVEKHFREVHLPNIIKPVERHLMSGPASRNLRSPGLQRLVRHAWDEQKRFPLQIATILSQQFASHGLQFFKVNRTVTHVTVARPHFLDVVATPVSDQVKRIVDFINAKPRSNRRKLVEALAPTPAAPPKPTLLPVAPPPVQPATDAGTDAGAPGASGAAEGSAPAAAAAPAPAEPGPTPEQASIIGDLHWLIHQGHVIEFANGVLETAKKPIVRPPKPPRAAAPAGGAKPEGAAAVGEQTSEPVVESAESATAPELAAEHPVESTPATASADVSEPTPEPPAVAVSPVPESSHEPAAT